MSTGTELLAIVGAGMLAAGLIEARAHRRALEAVPLRIHVNGTRGKSSVTKAIAALLRELGKTAVGKTTGTLPVIIEPDGTERRLRRRGRTRIQEQVRFLRYAADVGAEAAVIECMAVDPTLQWICEHRLVHSRIGVITNVRRDHFEEMGRNLEEIARSLANTVPRRGVLVTADARFAPLFEDVARPLGTRVVLVGDGEVERACALLRRPRGDDPSGKKGSRSADAPARLEEALLRMHAENVAVACKAVEMSGFQEATVWEAAKALPVRRMHVTDLSGPFGAAAADRAQTFDEPRRCFFVHAWSMNDTDSFGRLLEAAGAGESGAGRGSVAVLYNHRADRPLRAVDFGRLFSSRPDIRAVLVTGDAGGRRLLRRGGVPPEKMRRIRLPLTAGSVTAAVAEALNAAAPKDAGGEGAVVVFGCGNARGVEDLELGGDLPAASAGEAR